MLTAIDLSPACDAPTGIGRYITDLCMALHDSGARTLGVYRGHRGSPATSLTSTCTQTARYDFLGGRIGFRFVLPRILARERASVYHATTTLGTPHGFPCPVVATIHDLYPLLPDAAVPATHRRQFSSALTGLLSASKLIICPTNAVAADLQRLGGRLPAVRVIPHGIGVPRDPSPRPMLAPYVLTIGAIEGRKGYDRMAAHWRDEEQLPTWVHLGPVRFDPGSRIQSAMRAAGCRFLGYVDEETRWRWLQHAEILIQPSLHEGYGYPPLEAMAMGIPVIARPIPATVELLGNAPLWHDDDRSWREAVSTLIRNPGKRLEHIARGRAVASRYSFSSMAAAHLAAYEEASS